MRGPLTLSEIAAQLGGRVVGNADCGVRQIGSLARATGDQIAFLAHRRHLGDLEQTRAGAVVLPASFEGCTELPRIVVDDPYLYFARLSRLLNPMPACVPGTDPTARLHPRARIAATACIEAGVTVGAGAEIGERAWIGAGCHVGDQAKVGDDCRLFPNVVVYDRCVLGARNVLHAGAIIGADGFGYARDGQRWVAIPQIGRVVLGDDVDVGANTTIDRGAIDDTVIEEGVKLDNQIHIAHNVRIGAHTAIAACVGIAGSAIIGRNCEIGGAAMIVGHIRIADGSRISPGTLVSRSVGKGAYTGIFPFDEHAAWIKNAASLRRLSSLVERVRALEKRIMRKEPNSE